MRSLPIFSQPRAEKEKVLRLLLEKSKRQHSDLLGWTVTRRPWLKPGVRFDLVDHPFLVGLYGEPARVVVVYKASQMGASEYGVSYALHAADQRGATVLYLFPTDRHVSDFSSARIGPAIEASPYLSEIVTDSSAGVNAKGNKIRGKDQVTLKRVRDRFLYLRGAQVKPTGQAPGMKSVDADVLVLDEVDEMDPRAPAIAVKRLGHSAMKEERWISTPTAVGEGIHAKWLESDQREWFVRCDGCGTRQALTIEHVVTEWDPLGRPVAWYGDDHEAFAACVKCRRPLNRLGPGEWVAAVPGREVVGFHLSQLFSPRVTLLEIVRALDTSDETKRRETFNQNLGLPYTMRGGALTDEGLDDLRRDYAHGPVRMERCYMGVDVGRVLHVVIRAAVDVETGERAQRWAGEVTDFEDLPGLMRQYGVERVVCDALPETRKAREFQAAMGKGIVWLAYYPGSRIGSRAVEPAQWDKEKFTVLLDRTRTLDETMALFIEGQNTLPGHARDISDYYKHMKSIYRKIEDGPGGEQVAVYVENGPDHFAHAENYAMVAAMTPQPKRAGTWGRPLKR